MEFLPHLSVRAQIREARGEINLGANRKRLGSLEQTGDPQNH